MGYIIAAVVFVLGVLVVAMLLSARGPRGSGRVAPAGAKPVERSEPSADAPNPARSEVADADQQQQAQRRIPPE